MVNSFVFIVMRDPKRAPCFSMFFRKSVRSQFNGPAAKKTTGCRL
jgi:hypothetical protein